MTTTDDESSRAGRNPRDSKPIPPGSAAAMHSALADTRRGLDELRIEHLVVAERVLAAGGGALYFDDMLIMTMLQRSYGLVDAVIDLVDAFNLHAAAPLVRLQLDSLFRMCFLATAPEAPRVMNEFFKGREFQQIMDDEGRRLGDGRLKYRATEHHPWAIPVYNETSGWIHLSVTHLTTSYQAGTGDRGISMGIPLPRDGVPASMWSEVLGATARATDELQRYALGWADEKDRRQKAGIEPSEDGTR